MISAENDSQVFLVIECDDSQLADYVDGKIIKEIAVNFRKNEHHRAEMDRNTTLLLVCKHDIDTIDSSSKVKIEDDPYYFKKYVENQFNCPYYLIIRPDSKNNYIGGHKFENRKL